MSVSKTNYENPGAVADDREVVIERTFNAPVEKVWRALTDETQMKQWYFPQMPAFQPVVGFETKVDVPHEGKVYEHLWKVTEAVPNRKIAYTWKYVGYPGESVVSFELFPEGQKTRLKLSHTGLDTFLPKQHPEMASKNFFGGWTHFGGELAKFLEKQEAR
ncbi:MAG: SRPBCC domain-containing protein [Acidobacteriota bacterium]|nr:SRPBCC domain-containing protein [Acidobacteriota bacterium]